MAASPFDWNQYLTLATNLSGNLDEASQRTSISRSYYAVFHAATLHAKPNGYNERAHGRLWKMYQADADINAKRISAIRNQMKRARENADYASITPNVAAIVAQQLSDANPLINLLTQVPQTSPLPLPPAPRKVCKNCGAVVI
jgi:uncharacterized protein (UPF0332 family)